MADAGAFANQREARLLPFRPRGWQPAGLPGPVLRALRTGGAATGTRASNAAKTTLRLVAQASWGLHRYRRRRRLPRALPGAGVDARAHRQRGRGGDHPRRRQRRAVPPDRTAGPGAPARRARGGPQGAVPHAELARGHRDHLHGVNPRGHDQLQRPDPGGVQLGHRPARRRGRAGGQRRRQRRLPLHPEPVPRPAFRGWYAATGCRRPCAPRPRPPPTTCA